MQMRIRILALTGVLLVGAFGVIQGSGPAGAAIDPASFTNPVSNPYFPLKPGTTFVYRGSEGHTRFVERLTVTHRTEKIDGVSTKVIKDILFGDGLLAEKTTDWYAEDNGGTVWYFGERTATYDKNGNVKSREGSWRAGRNGGLAGVIMPANPVPTDAYRQEFLSGHAEDQAWIVARHEKLRVPYGSIKDVVRSYEWTRLEPNVVSLKLYGPGLGIVQEKDVAGGNEFMQLVAVHHR
jgi:hypothetical protein